MEKQARITLEEIAKEIGISRTTIYKVLKNKGNVSDETKKAVCDALIKYDYILNKNARNLAMNRQYEIAYIGFKSKSANYFSTAMKKGINRAVKEFGDDGLTVSISEFELECPAKQMEAVDKMLSQGITSFILAYSDADVIRAIVEKLKGLHCRVLLLSRDFEGNLDNYYVGVDYYRSGRLAAEIMGKLLPDGGDLFIPVTEEYKTNRDILARLNGFLDKLKEYQKVKVLPVAYGLLEENDIYRTLAEVIQSEKKLKGIFDLTYRLDIIGQVLKDLSRQEIKLTGFDLFEEIEGYVEDSTIDAVVYQDLNMQAYLSVKILFEELCYGKKPAEKKQYSKLEIVMQENLDYFKN